MMTDEPSETPTVIQHDGPAEWTLDVVCQFCGWPWRFYGTTRERTVDLHQTVRCPNCGQSYTLDAHYER